MIWWAWWRLKTRKETNGILDSRCSRHMTGDYSWCSSFTKVKYGGDFAFEDNSKGNIIGVGNVGKNYCTSIENVCLVDN